MCLVPNAHTNICLTYIHIEQKLEKFKIKIMRVFLCNFQCEVSGYDKVLEGLEKSSKKFRIYEN